MLTIMKFVVPALVIVFMVLPLVKVFKGEASASSAKKRLLVHIATFFITIFGLVVLTPTVFAADPIVAANPTRGIAEGLGFLSAALATGLSALGAGVAVAAAAPAAIGAISENPKNFGKALIFVALGEGVAIYGLLISILILNKIV